MIDLGGSFDEQLHGRDASPLRAREEANDADLASEGAHDARIEHLRSVPLFSDCTEDELRRVAEISRTVECPAGTVLTEIGRPGDSFFLIVDGRVSVQTAVGHGEGLHPGDFLVR